VAKLRAAYEISVRKRHEAIKLLRLEMENKDKKTAYELMNSHMMPGAVGPISTTQLFQSGGA
jgi:hypothetical protein